MLQAVPAWMTRFCTANITSSWKEEALNRSEARLWKKMSTEAPAAWGDSLPEAMNVPIPRLR